jgi:hypothetical protein
MIRALAGGQKPAALGHRVFRPGVLVTDLTIASHPIFQILGGDVQLTGFYGKVTTVLTGAGSLQPQYTITGGVARNLATPRALGGDLAGIIYTITGNVGVGLTGSTFTGIAVPSFTTNAFILAPGVISIDVTLFTATNGAIDWTIHYVPLSLNAYMIPL